jgi:ferrous iron transport protein B
VVDHGYAAGLGRLVSPDFEPLGFEWRINVAVLSAQAARRPSSLPWGRSRRRMTSESPAAAMPAMTCSDPGPVRLV